MPKVSKIQTAFLTGQISPSVLGRVDNPRYETALATCLNYIPILQGPLIRRPGTKYVTNWKDSSQPPALIPFQFSAGQNYMLEFGNKYIRFYSNEGQIVTSSNSFKVAGYYALTSTTVSVDYPFQAVRTTPVPQPGELLISSSLISAASILEVATPYSYQDTPNIKYSQKQDTLYLQHPNYPMQKLVRTGFNTWDFKQVIFQDGPYLPLNSYLSLGDAVNISLIPQGTAGAPTIETGQSFLVTNAFSNGSGGGTGNLIRLTVPNHNFSNGQKVFVKGVAGTVEANNASISGLNMFSGSSITDTYWTATNVTGVSLDLAGSNFVHTYVGSGIIYPALFQFVNGSSGISGADIMPGSSVTGSQNGLSLGDPYRNIALVQNGTRFWGHIATAIDAAHAQIDLGPGQILTNTSTVNIWQLGVYNRILGFPGASTFHQDRLCLTGAPGIPQEIDGSVIGQYENFAASGSTFQVANNNALQFNLTSQDVNTIKWMKSSTQGLVAGTASSEWAVSPSTQGAALSPTNISAVQVTAFGSSDADAVLSGNAVLYIQRAQKKLRELLYYWQVGSYRSTNLSDLSEYLTYPSIIKMVNQKETHANIWVLRSDGQLLTLTYSRDDVTLEANAGWSQHQLGGRSDSAGSPPMVKSIAVIPSGDGLYDELWIATQRYINGTSVGTIEYLTRPFDQALSQEFSYHFDCGATYNSSIVVTGISIGGSSIITAPNHGIANSSVIRFYNVVGLNVTNTDADGNTSVSNIFNENTFVVTSASTNTFFVQDFLGNYINTASASVYVNSAIVRTLVTQISGLTWLANETVGVLADGGIHVNTTVSNTGVLKLAYPAAIVSVGYPYNSDMALLRTKDGSAQGTSIGSKRRVNRVAFMLNNVGDLSFGPDFTSLVPCEFEYADVNLADTATPLFSGIQREFIKSEYGFTDTVCLRQNSGLPGMIQAVTRFLEETDV